MSLTAWLGGAAAPACLVRVLSYDICRTLVYVSKYLSIRAFPELKYAERNTGYNVTALPDGAVPNRTIKTEKRDPKKVCLCKI